MHYDLIIIGAGAAGLFAAANVRPGLRVLLLEKTDTPGQKLRLAGSGQCNLTNSEPMTAFSGRYGESGKRLRSVLNPFGNRALMAYFDELGLPLITREDGKVFPASMDGRDVVGALLDRSRQNGVEVRCNAPVTEIFTEKDQFILKTLTHIYTARNVLVTTGGASYPNTGSDGSFFACLEALGVALVPRRPALVPIYVRDYPYGKLAGISFPDAAITLISKAERRRITGRESLLLTHRGFSGPVILNRARYAAQGDELTICYLPREDAGTLRRRLLELTTGNAKQIGTALEHATGLPGRFLESICRRVGVAPDTKASRLSGRELGEIARLLTADAYEISGTGGFSAAMATAGGVSLDEVDLRTMESRRYPGLYFAGEVLDVDGDTGGYNLQFAFSSAQLAAGQVSI